MTPEQLVERLETVIADIDEMSFDLLREAVADGATARPTADKELVKARRAVEKAAAILRTLTDD